MRNSLILALASLAISGAQQPARVRLRAVEDLRLDATKEDFSTISGILVSERGHIVVPQRQDLQVRIYDASGKRVATVGRAGSGPGEFRSLSSLGWIGDTLWIFDGAQIRTTFVTATGRLLRTFPLPSLESAPVQGKLLGFSPVAYLRDGSTLGTARRVDASAKEHDFGSRVLVRFTPPSTVRVLATLPDDHDERWFMTIGEAGKYVPFAFRPQTAVTPRGERMVSLTVEVATNEEGTFTVGSVDNAGKALFSTSLPFRGAPIPSRLVDSALRALAPPPGRGLEGPDLTSQFQSLARRRMPKVFPPVQRLTAGLDQTAWITMRDAAQGRAVLGLNARGEPVGNLLLPANTRLEQATNSRIWVTETDSDGLTSIVRYRLTGWPLDR